MVKRKVKKFHKIFCTDCKRRIEVDIGVKAILCGSCTMKKMLKEYGVPKGALPKQDKGPAKPPGWHFYKEFVDKDGTVYHKGVEQPELKDTKKPTKIKPIKKKAKALSDNDKLKKQREIFKEIEKSKKALSTLIKAGKKRGKVGLQKKITKLQKEVRKYL